MISDHSNVSGGGRKRERRMPCSEKQMDVDGHGSCVQCPIRVPEKRSRLGRCLSPVPEPCKEMDQKEC